MNCTSQAYCISSFNTNRMERAKHRYDRVETEEVNDDRSKRLRIHGTTLQSRRHQDTNQYRETGDCYDEVMKGYILHVNGSVRSSWLNHVQWHTREEMIPSDIEEIESEQDCYDHIGITTQIQIRTQMHQLNEIKRKLWPAAEHCGLLDSHDAYFHFEQARRACNPLEILGEGRQGGLNTLFMNRSAIKLANLNAMLGFSLTRHNKKETFVFVDLCGAPGGFSEYILQHCRQPSCRGYGMSLIGHNEHGRGVNWRIGTTNNYQTCHGADGTGDIYNWNNVLALQSMVQRDCVDPSFPNPSIEDGKVHLVMADGGFDAQRDSEHQEELAQKICVCQASAALALLKSGGTFVMKMFGFQTTAVRTLIRNIWQNFDHMIVVKPISSRPASAERYVVFSGFKGTNASFDGSKWRDHTFLGDTGQGICSDDEAKQSRYLNIYLDAIDLDMITLNLKTCIAILSHLQRRVRNIEHDDYENETKAPRIDIDSYTREWYLH